MANIQQQIDAKVSAKNKLTADQSELRSQAIHWKNSADAITCKGSKPKKAACEKDKQWRYTKSSNYTRTANELQVSIDEINQQLESLYKSQDAQSTATITLAQSGKSLEAMVLESEGKSEALHIEAKLKGQAAIAAANTKASAEAAATFEQSKTINKGILIAGVVVGIIVLSVVYVKVIKK